MIPPLPHGLFRVYISVGSLAVFDKPMSTDNARLLFLKSAGKSLELSRLRQSALNFEFLNVPIADRLALDTTATSASTITRVASINGEGPCLMMAEQQVVIIGGSEGIGLAVAKAARTLGARVLAVSRTRAKLEAARDAVSGLEIRVADINNTASIQELFSELATVDHVYIAAGSTKTGGPLDHPLSEFRHKFDERLWGSIDVVRAAHRLMRPGGSFTFTGGLSSDRPVLGAWVSGIATMATEQLARVLALELAPIRFNAIAPGYTDTPMWDYIFPQNGAQALSDVTKKYPIPRLATADEVAQAVLLLMQNEAITGETIHVDCGARLV